MFETSQSELSPNHGSSGLDRKNPSTMLLSRTVTVTPEQAVTSVTQTASRTRLDAGCQIGELKLGITGAAGLVPVSIGDSGFPRSEVSECCRFHGDSSAMIGGGDWNDCLADPLILEPGRLTKSRAIPRGPCFRRFFTTTGDCSSGKGIGGLGAGFTGVCGCRLSTFVAVDSGCLVDSAGGCDNCCSCIRRCRVSGNGGRPRGRFTPSMLTFFA